MILIELRDLLGSTLDEFFKLTFNLIKSNSIRKSRGNYSLRTFWIIAIKTPTIIIIAPSVAAMTAKMKISIIDQ